MNTLVGFLAWFYMKLWHVACQQHLHIDAFLVVPLVLANLVAIVIVGQCVRLAVKQFVGNSRFLYLLTVCQDIPVAHKGRHESFYLLRFFVADYTESLRPLYECGQFRVLLKA